jgi:catechol 2,3-dioxygenase-like lactoylglutathione lyase family enzyme
MAANPFTWVEIYVQDLERAKTFYEAVFDFKLEKLQTEIPMWAFPADPGQWGAGGALVKIEGVPSRGGRHPGLLQQHRHHPPGGAGRGGWRPGLCRQAIHWPIWLHLPADRH